LVDSRVNQREFVGFEQRASGARVGPHAVVQPRDDDNVELAANRRRGSAHQNGTGGGTRRERVVRDGLPEHTVEEDIGGFRRDILE
jgi:hypothetical protein